MLAALAGVVEHDSAVLDPDVSLFQRHEPVAAVLVGVFLSADPHQTLVEQAHGAREHALPVSARHR